MSGRRPNREILTGGKKYIQKQNKKHGVDEVTFDKDSRQEYLTGFHKRKLQRQKKAQEYHKEQDRLARIEERKRLRDERKKDLQTQLQKFNESVKDVTSYDNSDDEYDSKKGKFQVENDSDSDSDGDGENEDQQVDEQTGESDEWEGIKDNEPSTNHQHPKGILQHREVYQIDDPTQFENTDAIIDDDTTVTVESVDNPIMTNIQRLNLEARAKANNVNLEKSHEILDKSIKRAQNYAVTAGVSKPSTKERIKKKKFRYLSKAERRENNRKQKEKKFRLSKRQ